MCRSDGLIGLNSTRTSASPGAKGGVGISASSNTLLGSPVSRKINAFINTSRVSQSSNHCMSEGVGNKTPFKVARETFAGARTRQPFPSTSDALPNTKFDGAVDGFGRQRLWARTLGLPTERHCAKHSRETLRSVVSRRGTLLSTVMYITCRISQSRTLMEAPPALSNISTRAMLRACALSGIDTDKLVSDVGI